MDVDERARRAVGALGNDARERLRRMMPQDDVVPSHADRPTGRSQPEYDTTVRLRDALDEAGVMWRMGWHDEGNGAHVHERGATSVMSGGAEVTFFDNLDGTFETRLMVGMGDCVDIAKRLCLSE